MFGIGVPELVLILIIGLVIFGPGRLPEIGRAIGKGINEFKRATRNISKEDEENKEIFVSEVKKIENNKNEHSTKEK